MMDYIEELIKKSDFLGTKLSSGNKTYIVKESDNYSYKDPIDSSIASKKVSKKCQKKNIFLDRLAGYIYTYVIIFILGSQNII